MTDSLTLMPCKIIPFELAYNKRIPRGRNSDN